VISGVLPGEVIATAGIDIYFARQLINERLSTVELPTGISRPQMGPVSTGLGKVFHLSWCAMALTSRKCPGKSVSGGYYAVGKKSCRVR